MSESSKPVTPETSQTAEGDKPEATPQENAKDVPATKPPSTMETTTVDEESKTERDNSKDVTNSEETKPEEAEGDKPPLSTDNAPAFQPAKASGETDEFAKPIVLPADPDGSLMVNVTRNALRSLIPEQQNGAIHDLLNKVARDETTTRAVSVLLARILRHQDARNVNLRVLGDVLQGNESEHFASHGLDEGNLLEFFTQVTPEAIRQLAA